MFILYKKKLKNWTCFVQIDKLFKKTEIPPKKGLF